MSNIVSVFKAGAFANFQEFIPTFYKQLKYYVHSLEDIFVGHNAIEVDSGKYAGFIVEGPDATTVNEYFTTHPLLAITKSYTLNGSTASNVVPGSVSFVIDNPKFKYIADDGNGRLIKDTDVKVGTIDYTTGNYVFTNAGLASATGIVSYAVTGTTATVIDGDDYNYFDNGLIPNGNCPLTCQVVFKENSKYAFIGFTTDTAGKEAAAKLLDEFTINVTSITVAGDDTMTKGSSKTYTATVSPANASFKKVKWSTTVSGGVITNEGVFTAPNSATTGDIVATALDDSGITGKLTVTITD